MATETCSQCGRSADNHEGLRHEFNQPLPSAKKPDEGTLQPLKMPIDPVLRIALIDAGVLTPEDLRRAEAKMSVTGGMVALATDPLPDPEQHEFFTADDPRPRPMVESPQA